MTIEIRPSRLDDLETIIAFNANLASETENKVLESDTLRAGVTEILTNPQRGSYFVAEVDGNVIGQIMFTHEWSDWRNGDILWIQSVYVAKSHRRQGVFATLLARVQEVVDTSSDVIGIRLYVENDNIGAQETYLDQGFRRPGYVVMERLT